MAYFNLPILLVHLVWRTKDRKPWIGQSFKEDLYAYIGGIFRNRKHVLIDAGGVANHLHLLVGMHQSQSIADCVRDVKSHSSSWIHDRFPGAFAVSESNVASVKAVKAYIQNQDEHHKTMSFQEEFFALLQKHNIAFDERYVLE